MHTSFFGQLKSNIILEWNFTSLSAVPIIWGKKNVKNTISKGFYLKIATRHVFFVIKLLMAILFFISELIFSEITWWIQPEWWPGRQNSLVSEVIKSSILWWFRIFLWSLQLLSAVSPILLHIPLGASLRLLNFVQALQVWHLGSPATCWVHTVPESSETEAWVLLGEHSLI